MDVSDIRKMQDHYLAETTTVKYRIQKLKDLKNAISEHEDNIMKALKTDFYKPDYETYAAEILTVYKEIKCFVNNITEWSEPGSVPPSILNFPASNKIYRDPYGKTLIISPWNYPFQLAVMPMIAAFACGNAIVIKPSEFTPETANVIEKIVKTVFDRNEVIVIKGGIDTSQELLQQKWDYIFFTGSSAVGKIVAKAAAEHLTPTTLELSGKNPCVVDETANLKLAAKRITWGKWLNAGQTCIAPDTLLVHRSIKTKLINELKIRMDQFYPEGINDDLAGIINEKHFIRLNNLIKNAHVIYGGSVDQEKFKISPTLIDEPELSSPIMNQEIFGPLFPIIGYSSEEELNELLDHFHQPLAYFIFTGNKKRAQERMKQNTFGGGVINDSIIHVINEKLPFGGVGNSGMGQYHGYYSFKTFTREKAVVDHKTWYDQPFRYPPYKGKLGLLKKLRRWIA